MLLAVVHWVSYVKLIFILAYYIIHQKLKLNTTPTPRAERKATMAMAFHFEDRPN